MSQSTIFQSCPYNFLSSLVEPVLKQRITCLAKGHNTQTLSATSLEIPTLDPQSNALPTEPLRSVQFHIQLKSYTFILLSDFILAQLQVKGQLYWPEASVTGLRSAVLAQRPVTWQILNHLITVNYLICCNFTGKYVCVGLI